MGSFWWLLLLFSSSCWHFLCHFWGNKAQSSLSGRACLGSLCGNIPCVCADCSLVCFAVFYLTSLQLLFDLDCRRLGLACSSLVSCESTVVEWAEILVSTATFLVMWVGICALLPAPEPPRSSKLENKFYTVIFLPDLCKAIEGYILCSSLKTAKLLVLSLNKRYCCAVELLQRSECLRKTFLFLYFTPQLPSLWHLLAEAVKSCNILTVICS